MKIKVKELGIDAIFLIIGIVLIIGGIFYINDINKFKENAIRTNAKVLDVKSSTDDYSVYTVYLTYNVDGKEYNYSYRTDDYTSKNSTQAIYYDKNKPQKAKVLISYENGVYLICFGSISCMFGICMLVYTRNTSKKKLRKTGNKNYKSKSQSYCLEGSKMHDFKQYLEKDEVILYEGRAIPVKCYNIWGDIFLILFFLMFQIMLIYSFSIFLFGVTLIFDVIAIGDMFNAFFIKKRVVKNYSYCITNKRALKYNSRKDKLFFGYLKDYEYIDVHNAKDNYGDLRMRDGSKIEKMKLNELIRLMFNPESGNIPFIVFDSIENPYLVLDLVEKTRKELLEK